MIYTLTDNSVTVLDDNFVPKTMPKNHPAFEQVVEALKADNDNEVRKLMDLPGAISSFTQGKVQVVDRQLFYDGKPINNSLAQRILQFIEQGEETHATPLINFLEKVKQNPSRRAVEGLFDWSVRSGLPITPDGDLIAYKIVRNDFRDYHSGSFDNSIGNLVEVPRNEVDEDPDRTCSHGLHFCSIHYLPHYYSQDHNRRVVVVKIHPADVVAFPRDYSVSKGRAYRYEVIGEVPAEKADTYFRDAVVVDPQFDNDGNESKLDLDVEVGRYYRTAGGEIAHITSYDDIAETYVYDGYIVGGCAECWTYDGLWSTHEPDDRDLVELLPEDFAPEETEPAPRRGVFGAFFDAVFRN